MIKDTFRLFAAFTISLGLLLGTSVMAETLVTDVERTETASELASRYEQETLYNVTRNGKKIGTHAIRFEQANGELLVKVDSSIRVTVLKVPVYRLDYTSEEKWIDNVLSSVTATTKENGNVNTVELLDSTASAHFSSNHWNSGVLGSSSVFNTLTGDISNVTVTPIGIEQVRTDTALIAANRYRYSGDVEADVWYDEAGLWLKMQFSRDDGSVIRYLRTGY